MFVKLLLSASSDIFTGCPSAGEWRELCSMLMLRSEEELRYYAGVRRGSGEVDAGKKYFQWHMQFSSRVLCTDRPWLKCALKCETSLWQQGPWATLKSVLNFNLEPRNEHGRTNSNEVRANVLACPVVSSPIQLCRYADKLFWLYRGAVSLPGSHQVWLIRLKWELSLTI